MSVSLFDPEVFQNPFPIYQQLRHNAPVHYEESMYYWMISRHADVLELLKSNRVTSQIPPIRPRGPMSDEVAAQQASNGQMMDNWLNFVEPSKHRGMRNMVSKGFLPRIVEGMRADVRALVHRLLDKVQDNEEMDVPEDFGYPLALGVIGDLFGVPEEDHPLIKDWAHKMITYFNDFSYCDPNAIGGMHQVRTEMGAYLVAMVEERSKNLGDDFMSALIVAMNEDKIEKHWLIMNLIFLLFAGHETTVNLIGNGVKALLDNPDQYRILQEKPDLIPTAVEEFLRFGSPAQYTGRMTVEEIEVSGVTIGAGQQLILLLGSANRDESVFENAEQLDIRRDPNPHLGFGQGTHYCLGAPLARLEAFEAFSALLERCPNMKANGEPRLRFAPALRGYEHLPISWQK